MKKKKPIRRQKNKFMQSISTFLDNINSLLVENGKWSSMRFAAMFATVVPLTVWSIISLMNSKVEDFPESIAIIIAGALGSKWLQKREEIKSFRDSLMDLNSLKYSDDNSYNDIHDDNSDDDNYNYDDLDPIKIEQSQRKPRKY